MVSVFAPEFTDNSDGRPSCYGKDAPAKLHQHLNGLFAEYQANLNLITFWRSGQSRPTGSGGLFGTSIIKTCRMSWIKT